MEEVSSNQIVLFFIMKIKSALNNYEASDQPEIQRIFENINGFDEMLLNSSIKIPDEDLIDFIQCHSKLLDYLLNRFRNDVDDPNLSLVTNKLIIESSELPDIADRFCALIDTIKSFITETQSEH